MIRIKTIREEFEAAEENGYVYGEIIRKKSFPVYIELGREVNYIPSPSDNPKTDYRLFRECHIFVAETNEQLDREDFVYDQEGESVIIYC